MSDDNSSASDEREKLFVNDLLYYVNYKRKINAVNDVIVTCEGFYSSDAIVEAKRQFFDAVGERDGLRFIMRWGDRRFRSLGCSKEIQILAV